jgi:ketosteroid isomerase-like protein
MPSAALDAFRRGYLRGVEAVNSHDFESAFGALSDDFEYHTFEPVADWDVARGPEAIVAAFGRLVEQFPDWRVEPREFTEVRGGTAVVVRLTGRATGRSSGVAVEQDFSEVWELRDGRPVRVRSYLDHDEALKAARSRRRAG